MHESDVCVSTDVYELNEYLMCGELICILYMYIESYFSL